LRRKGSSFLEQDYKDSGLTVSQEQAEKEAAHPRDLMPLYRSRTCIYSTPQHLEHLSKIAAERAAKVERRNK
jgi:hypothetical protein